MRVARGKVVGNTVVLEGEPLPEGSQVTVWAEDVEGFELDEQSQHALMEADAACEEGGGISAAELYQKMAQLRAR